MSLPGLVVFLRFTFGMSRAAETPNPATHPNVLFIISDDLTSTALS